MTVTLNSDYLTWLNIHLFSSHSLGFLISVEKREDGGLTPVMLTTEEERLPLDTVDAYRDALTVFNMYDRLVEADPEHEALFFYIPQVIAARLKGVSLEGSEHSLFEGTDIPDEELVFPFTEESIVEPTRVFQWLLEKLPAVGAESGFSGDTGKPEKPTPRVLIDVSGLPYFQETDFEEVTVAGLPVLEELFAEQKHTHPELKDHEQAALAAYFFALRNRNFSFTQDEDLA